ncbi:MAG: hypothetical protein HKO53_12615 [Gemmatimonadetes bacterium]|nr:hypothetical protein [Gemmatimonadota bacterium]
MGKGEREGGLFSRCLFCSKPFPQGRILEDRFHGRRVAFDPSEARMWSICDHCARWNLVPSEDRGAQVGRLERIARDRGKLLSATENVALLEVPGGELVRIGRAHLAEAAWWRYGKELQSRRNNYERPGKRIAGYAFGAVALITDGLGLADLSLGIGWGDSPLADILRYRHFGWAAWYGRKDCPFCGSTLRALRYDVSWWTFLLPSEDNRVRLGVPCPRCDPWTPEKVFQLEADEAESVLRRILAYQHITGASEDMVKDAAREIEGAGSAAEFRARVADQRMTLWRLGRERSIALEIAVNEAVEARLLSLEASALEFVWRREEALARIIDEELTPPRFLDKAKSYLPPQR